MEPENRVQWVYASKDDAELAERYDQWAAEYEADLDRDFGYSGPADAAEIFVRHVPSNARVLDAGAGTGLVGLELQKRGYADVVAMDMSKGMLAEAESKGVYRALHRMVMGEQLGFETDSFDAVISVGVLTLGHAAAESFDELVRVTRPGGHVVFTLRPDIYENNGFKEKQDALVSAGKWELVEVTKPFRALPKGEPDVYHQVWVYQVSPA